MAPAGRGGKNRIRLRGPELTLQADGPDLFAALQELGKTLAPLGWFPLCNGARVDCYPSSMACDMGGGASVQVLNAKLRQTGKSSSD